MAETQTVDEVVSTRTNTRGGTVARPVEGESVTASTGAVKADRNGVEDETHGEGGRRGRAFKDSTAKLLEKFEKEDQDARSNPAPHEEGDPDEEEAAETAGDGVDVGEAGAPDDGTAEAAAPEADKAATEDPVAEWRSANDRLATRNQELISELETARKTPKAQRSDRETALVAAEASYIDEGSVPALRKFLSIITGAAPDSKEVDTELAGVYIDLTARELGVSLDQNQQTLRDNARTRLLLARDKREKVEAGKKPEVDNSADTAQYEQAARHVDNMLVTKGQSGTSLADEYPLLMDLAQDFDGFTPAEVLARAIRQEIMTGTLDPRTGDIDMVRIVAPKIEKHYDAVAKKIEAARAKKLKTPGTTTTSGKPKVAIEASQERQSTGARTLTNAAASRAPAAPPKTTQPKAKTTTEKTRKDFKTDAEWRDHLLSKHFKS